MSSRDVQATACNEVQGTSQPGYVHFAARLSDAFQKETRRVPKMVWPRCAKTQGTTAKPGVAYELLAERDRALMTGTATLRVFWLQTSNAVRWIPKAATQHTHLGPKGYQGHTSGAYTYDHSLTLPSIDTARVGSRTSRGLPYLSSLTINPATLPMFQLDTTDHQCLTLLPVEHANEPQDGITVPAIQAQPGVAGVSHMSTCPGAPGQYVQSFHTVRFGLDLVDRFHASWDL